MHGGGYRFAQVTHNASLADVSPTVLDIMGVSIPNEMTGVSLISPSNN